MSEPLGDMRPDVLWAAVNAYRIARALSMAELATGLGCEEYQLHDWAHRGLVPCANTLLCAEEWVRACAGVPGPRKCPNCHGRGRVWTGHHAGLIGSPGVPCGVCGTSGEVS